ncbi:EGF-like domain protein [Trichuris suis]|nr:EGF-like domain protein [Trichuris suis]
MVFFNIAQTEDNMFHLERHSPTRSFNTVSELIDFYVDNRIKLVPRSLHASIRLLKPVENDDILRNERVVQSCHPEVLPYFFTLEQPGACKYMFEREGDFMLIQRTEDSGPCLCVLAKGQVKVVDLSSVERNGHYLLPRGHTAEPVEWVDSLDEFIKSSIVHGMPIFGLLPGRPLLRDSKLQRRELVTPPVSLHITEGIENDNPCVPSPCQNGASCILNHTSPYGYTCLCKPGFFGLICEASDPLALLTVDLCKKLNCVNGLCIAKEGVFEVDCKCYTGWSGEQCTIDKDECQETKDLCSNNGVCADPKGNYTCTCHAGYTGKNCENDVNECANADCINGYCTDLVNGYKCDCYTGYTGEKCATKLNPCAYLSYDCGKGWCVSTGKIPRCICLSGYTGIHCEMAISKCEKAPCENGGICTDKELINQFECICPPKYGGVDCSVYDNPCVPSPCRNGASCFPNDTSPYGYTCLCKPGFHGLICEASERFALLNINECEQSPCKNGECKNTRGSYYCMCKDGWIGKHCETDVDECNYASICGSRGTCRNTPGSFHSSILFNVPFMYSLSEINKCDAEPCVNGLCVDGQRLGEFKCICQEGYGGFDCSIEDNRCIPPPCHNGAPCVINKRLPYGYSCTCKDGYFGNLCEGSAFIGRDVRKAKCRSTNHFCAIRFRFIRTDRGVRQFCVIINADVPNDELTVTNKVVLVRPAPAKWYFAKSFPPIAMRTMAYSSWNTCGLVSAFVVVHFVNMSLAATIACPHVGVCSIEIDRDRCLFVSNRPQILFTNEVCSSEHPNGTLYAFKMPAGTKESFYPLHFFYAYPKHCTYFDVPGPVYLKYRNAWLIVGFEHRRGSWNMKYIKLHLKHAITHERDTVEYKFFHDGTLISIGNYSVIANGDVMREILRKGASEERPLAILLKAADIRPKFGEQSVLTFAELEKDDREGARNSGYQLLNRATCEFPSRRKVCMRFNEQTGECTCRPGYSGTFCSTDINECDQTPCKNGYCSNTYGSYHCVCDAGWVGEHCEIDVNECDYPDICGSRGTCRNTPGSFQLSFL